VGYTYQDLHLPSIGEFTVGNMRTARHPIVRALGEFLMTKGNYKPGDRFTVRHIRHLADYVDGSEGSYDLSRILVGRRGHFGSSITQRRDFGGGRLLLATEVVYVMERSAAIEAYARRRYGRGARPLLRHLMDQHWTFDLE
jgi:hypothetical protein